MEQYNFKLFGHNKRIDTGIPTKNIYKVEKDRTRRKEKP